MLDLIGREESADVRARRPIPRFSPRLLVLVLPFVLGACGVPPALQIASWVSNAFSYLTTSKSVSDHGISLIAGRDCALHRGLAGGDVCRESGRDNEAMLASLDRVNDASRDPWEAVVEVAGVPEERADSIAPSLDMDLAAEPMEANSLPPVPMPAPALLPRDEPIAMPASLDMAPETREPIAATSGFMGEGPPVVKRFADPVWERAGQPAGPNANRRTAAAVQDTGTHRVGAPPKRGVYYSLASFAVLANAEKLMRRNAGLSPSLMTARINGKNFYRVVVGPIAGSQGKELRQEIASAGFRDAWALWAAPPRIEDEAG